MRTKYFSLSVGILITLLLSAFAFAPSLARASASQVVAAHNLQGINTQVNTSTALSTTFTYQGQLKDASGNPFNTTCDITFRLWDAKTGGAQLGTDSLTTGVIVANGYFTAQVNSAGEFGSQAFTDQASWLGVSLQCSGDTTTTTLSPRQPLTASPYALYAQAVGSHSHWSDNWSGSGVGLTLSGGTTGLSGSGSSYGLAGQSDSSTGAGVSGWASSSTGITYGVMGKSDSTDGRGLYGYTTATTGTNYGVFGRSAAPEGRGVYGEASASTGSAFGVYGNSASSWGAGVFGFAFSTTGSGAGVGGSTFSPDGFGLYGSALDASGSNYGVYGYSNSTAGTGVFGEARAISGVSYGVYGKTNSTTGYGVYGLASATVGQAFGVYGLSASTDGAGVFGYANATNSSFPTYGVLGWADSTSAVGTQGWVTAASGVTYGVHGQSESTSGTGVYGYATATTGTTYGVIGVSNSPSGYGVYSIGNFSATGAKSAVVNTQSNGWLHLYSVESPEVVFEDYGTTQMVNGMAVVIIDPKFAETVNLNLPYQVFLTPRGDCGLYLAETTPSSFTVHAQGGVKCNLAFDYRIVAKRLGYEDVRMAPATDPTTVVQNANLQNKRESAQPVQPPSETQP